MMRTLKISRQPSAWISTVLLSMVLHGCGGGEDKPTAEVHGKVTHNGQPVPGGGLTFAPVAGAEGENPGMPATATIQSDGTYSLSTYGEGDGAVIGKHRISFSPPAAPGAAEESAETEETDPDAHAEPLPPSPYANLVPKEAEVEVKDGGNEINIELVAGPAAEG